MEVYSGKYRGLFMSIFICIITLPFTILPYFSILAIDLSDYLVKLIRMFIPVSQCELEMTIVVLFYILLSLVLSLVFYVYHKKKNVKIPLLILFLVLQFIILQIPFLLFEIGIYYYCNPSGNPLLGSVFSSFKVSFVLIIFGAIYDLISKKEET